MIYEGFICKYKGALKTDYTDGSRWTSRILRLLYIEKG